MTSRERIEAALSHREPDRTPVFEYLLFSPVADAVLGHDYIDFGGDLNSWMRMANGMGWEQALRRYASDRLTLADKLEHDMLYVVPNPVEEDLKKLESSDECPAHLDLQKDDPVERLRTRNELEREKPKHLNEDRFLVYHYLLEEMGKRDMDLPIKAPAYAHGIWTDVDLMQTLLLEPEIAHEHFELATGRAMKLVGRYLEIGIKQIGIGGDFAGNRLLISPDSYSEFIVPQLMILSKKIHESGGWAINASDGNLWPVIEDFLINSGVDGYIEIDSRAGMDLKLLKEKYGDRITLYGNMDCGNVLSFSSTEEIRKNTIECLENGWGGGGHIFTASNAITESVSLANYLAMVNAYRDVFNLRRIEIG